MSINENDQKNSRVTGSENGKTKGFLSGLLTGFGRKAETDAQAVRQYDTREPVRQYGTREPAKDPADLNLGLGEPNAIVPVDDALATLAATEHARCLGSEIPVAQKADNTGEDILGSKKPCYDRRVPGRKKPEDYPHGTKWWLETPAKLTIFLLENSTETRDPEFWDFIKSEVIAKHLENPSSNLLNNAYSFNSAPEVGYVCFIRYEDTVSSGALMRVDNNFNLDDIALKPGLQTDTLRLYEAIQRLRGVVNYSLTCKSLSYKGRTEKIKEIEIVGIGRGIDSGSVNSKSCALETLSKILNRKNITNKYYCLSEDDFPRVAALGFRNIVSMTDRDLEIFDSE